MPVKRRRKRRRRQRGGNLKRYVPYQKGGLLPKALGLAFRGMGSSLKKINRKTRYMRPFGGIFG